MYLIKDAHIVNEGQRFIGSLLTNGSKIYKIYKEKEKPEITGNTVVIDASGKLLLPGVIDDQVHFRQPGLTHKGDILSESRAAVAGGITSYMEMPNTNPQTTTLEALQAKYQLGAENSMANYSFYMGATNDNLSEILKTNPKEVCGIKIFMGSSTGNMLVDKLETLEAIFKESPLLIATHCEDEASIIHNTSIFKDRYADHIPIKYHPEIRNYEACYKSSSLAVDLASKYNTRLHVLHLSSAKEMELFSKNPISEKRITGEVCVHHLWFSDLDYDTLGTYIKWNPSVKYEKDRSALWEALLDGRLDVIATDHAPHTIEEKQNSYLKAPSGGPLVQHSLVAMLEFVKQGKISIEKLVEKMCHAPAQLFNIEQRGYIREGYSADLVLVDPNNMWTVDKNNILYKCGWSPFESIHFSNKISHTFINGCMVYNNGVFDEDFRGDKLKFNR